MTKKIILGSSLAAMLLAGGIAVAAPGGPKGDRNKSVTRTEVIAQVDARFAKMDVDKDGTLTAADRAAMHKARADQRFARMDADKSGQISRAEFDAADEQRMGKRGGPDGARKMGRGGMHHGMARGGPQGPKADVTLAQFRATALARFDRQDANRDGTVTPAERKASREAMRAEWKADRAARKAQ